MDLSSFHFPIHFSPAQSYPYYHHQKTPMDLGGLPPLFFPNARMLLPPPRSLDPVQMKMRCSVPNSTFTIDRILGSDSMGNDTVQSSKNHKGSLSSKSNTSKRSSKNGSQIRRQQTDSKRMRTIFTPEQLDRLEAEFDRQQYMVGSERYYLAASLNLTEAQVKVWFQNRRIKWRKQHLGEQRELLHMDMESYMSPRPYDTSLPLGAERDSDTPPFLEEEAYITPRQVLDKVIVDSDSSNQNSVESSHTN